MKNLALLLIAASIFELGQLSAANACVACPDEPKFRKCEFKIMVSGSGLSATEVPNGRFIAWGRGELGATHATTKLKDRAGRCMRKILKKDYRSMPDECARNRHILKNRDRYGSGLSDLTLTNARTAMKAAICKAHKYDSENKVRTIADTRKIEGLQVYIQKVSGNGSCPRDIIIGPRAVELHCRKAGADSKYEWHYKK